MRKTKQFTGLLIVLVIFFGAVLTSCNVSTANLSNVKLCSTSELCTEDQSSFHSDVQVIYCSAELKNAPSETKVTFDWKQGDQSIAKADVSSGSGAVNSTLRISSPLPPGKYSVTVKINTDNAKPVTKEFTITE